ncbi:hypothetical protein SDC9_129003 [bioreactor metagenome]|uniref:Uncharacterized protein n=1 Tax=bioreactor metagenome TaxID=1076179 RepID=A0A645CYI6_9ZZZZ
MRAVTKSSQFFSSPDAPFLHITDRDFYEIILDGSEIRHRDHFLVGSPDSRGFFRRQIIFDHGGFLRAGDQRMPKLHLLQFTQEGQASRILQQRFVDDCAVAFDPGSTVPENPKISSILAEYFFDTLTLLARTRRENDSFFRHHLLDLLEKFPVEIPLAVQKSTIHIRQNQLDHPVSSVPINFSLHYRILSGPQQSVC